MWVETGVFLVQIINVSISNNVYATVMMAEPLSHFTQFTWWMQNSVQVAANLEP